MTGRVQWKECQEIGVASQRVSKATLATVAVVAVTAATVTVVTVTVVTVIVATAIVARAERCMHRLYSRWSPAVVKGKVDST